MDRWARFASDGSDDLDQHGLVIFFLNGFAGDGSNGFESKLRWI